MCFFTAVILVIVSCTDYFIFSCMIFKKKKEKFLNVRPYWILRRTGEELLVQQSTYCRLTGLSVEFQMQFVSRS